ncbi:BspA family leucine-rich repeat surface protein [Allomuricauda sp. F6463D]|uniref:BspA family leucine-rich repeat surface protein n=1 Tax=Allomuricauda sp. F6463D TaxID=2926409 RepID=UPI001FF2997F|nr:BspA family leucine-rich repeat surface protein [Muricauda sp. F6463D]MCK0159822.1 BspA family leucine-rich repeat surface protein [Muricauda sp. F6463D]
MKKKLLFIGLFLVLIWSCGKDDGPTKPKNNVPKIKAQNFIVNENIGDTVVIGIIAATDEDGDALTFTIKSDASGLFNVTNNGTLTLVTGKKLDFEISDKHTLTVSVTDGSLSASASITVNVTKEDPENQSPVIEEQDFVTTEGITDTDVIGTVTATDSESDTLVFSITENDNDLFEITSDGELSLREGEKLDFEMSETHTLTVSVTDGSLSSSANITINVTKVDTENQSPVIEEQEFETSEGITDTDVIGTVTATDNESDTLMFSITDNDNDLFEITPDGELSLIQGGNLDFETTIKHTIVVEVTDGNSSVSNTITINVTDEDEAPIIEAQEFEAPEDISDTEIIGVVTALDPEEGDLTFSISVNDNGLFEISANGELTLADGRELDFETSEEHIVTIAVTDGIAVAEAEVSITVEDIMDSLAEEPSSFVTTWNVAFDGQEITIGTDFNFIYLYTIDWGDGNIEEWLDLQNPSHVYETAGMYTVAIQGNFPAIKMGSNNDVDDGSRLALKSIKQWGTISWRTFNNAFSKCLNMQYSASDVPQLSQVIDMSYMFYDADSFNGDLNGWDVSNVVNMEWMFLSANSFNGNISGWDTGKVNNMARMFYNADSFNRNISGWNTGNVTNMSRMFWGADTFNQNLGTWNIGLVTDMMDIFSFTAFSAQNFTSTLVGWEAAQNTPDNIDLGAKGINLCDPEGVSAHDSLINDHNWTIDYVGNVNCN